ncbi:MAG: YbhB/YbcL family Raf kinase inhibitor-like protein [Oligoflexia bacterium]|jgi:Raf kinase inhibitor-like YbhB/YbcL family protein
MPEKPSFPGFTLWTDAIDPASREIEARYTCDLDNSSPELRWENPPADTHSFALVLRDPDAPGGDYYHWLVYAIPAELRHLPAGIPAQEILPNGVRQGLNSHGRLGYFGPCPPLGDPAHRYLFELYALGGGIAIAGRKIAPHPLLAEIQKQALARAVCQGTYRRFAKRSA